jgi:HlyD family secretion protein
MSSKSHSEPDLATTLGLDHASGRSKRLRRWLTAILLVGVVVVIVVVWKNAGKSATTQFETQEAQRGDLVVLVTATGTLQPTNEVEVGSEISGIVKSVDADYNDKVKVGQDRKSVV